MKIWALKSCLSKMSSCEMRVETVKMSILTTCLLHVTLDVKKETHLSPLRHNIGMVSEMKLLRRWRLCACDCTLASDNTEFVRLLLLFFMCLDFIGAVKKYLNLLSQACGCQT